MKRSVIVNRDGGPLRAVIAGANVHDIKLLAQTIEAVVVERSEPTEGAPKHFCLDNAYCNPTGRAAAAAKGHTPHCRQIGEESAVRRGGKALLTSVGSGADAYLAIEVPCDPGAPRQELIQLPGVDSPCVQIAMVSKAPSVEGPNLVLR